MAGAADEATSALGEAVANVVETAEGDVDGTGVAQTVVAALPTEQVANVAIAAAGELPREQRGEVLTTVVDAAKTVQEQTALVVGAAENLTTAQKRDIASSLMPQDSGDRRAVFVAGFVVAGVLALGLSLIAWGAADTGNDGVATAAIAAAVSIPSAIIGGLLGAYVGH
jgi:hypothetical protein